MSITITKHMAFKSGGKSLTVYRDTDKNDYVTFDGLSEALTSTLRDGWKCKLLETFARKMLNCLIEGDDIMPATFGSDFTFVRKHEMPRELLKGQYISSEHFAIYGGTINGKKGFYFRPAPLARLLGVRYQYGSEDLFSATLVGACDIFDQSGDSAEEFHYCRLECLEPFLSAYIKRLPLDSECRLHAFNVSQWLREKVLPRYFDESPDVAEVAVKTYSLPNEILYNHLSYRTGFAVLTKNGNAEFDPRNLSDILGTNYCSHVQKVFAQAVARWSKDDSHRLENLLNVMCDYLVNVPHELGQYKHGVQVLEWLLDEVLPHYSNGG